MFIVFSCWSILDSQENLWQDNGIAIRQGSNIEWARAGAELSDGSVVYTWSDTRNGDRDVYAQRIDNNGNFLWNENGVLVNGEINRQEDPVVINTQDTSVVIAWVDFRNEEAGDVYCQKLDSAGELLWDATGVPLCLSEDVQITLNIVNDTEGGAYILWYDHRNPGGVDIYGTHILVNGSIATGWDSNGNPLAAESGDQNQHTFWADGSGGAILVWHDTREATNPNIYAQRILSDGTLDWSAGGVVVSDASNSQEKPKISPDATGNFIITWLDKRYENDGDIFAQRIDLDGNTLWSSDLEVYVNAGSKQKNPRITASSDTGVFVVWEDGRNDPYSFDLYAQKISPQADLLWDASGVSLSTANADQLEPRLIGGANGDCYFIWEDEKDGGHPNENIYMQFVDAAGNTIWEDNGKLICDADVEQFSPLLRFDGLGKAYAVWGDKRTGSIGLYCQIIDSIGNEYLDSNGKLVYYGLSGNALNYGIKKNGDYFSIVWEDSRFPTTGLQIYMQLLDNTGYSLFEENGFSVTQNTGYDQVNPDFVVKSDASETAIVWEENRFGFKQIYGQAVDNLGNRVWLSSGLKLGDFIFEQQHPHISYELQKSKDNIYYVGWSDYRDIMNPACIYGQKVVDGSVAWSSEGKEIVNRSTGEDILSDIVGRYFIWYNDNWPEFDVYVKLVDENGNAATGWPEDGLAVCDASGSQKNPKGVMTNEGLLIIWEDKRNGNADIYGQIVNEDATVDWQEDGLPLVQLPNDQDSEDCVTDNYIYLNWADFRSGSDYDLYIQKYNFDGNEEWNTAGNIVSDAGNNQLAPSIADVGDNIFVTWEDFSDTLNSDIYSQKVTDSGDLAWSDPFVVCNAIKRQIGPKTCSSGQNQAVIIWQDTRSSGKADIYNIYAQKVQVNEEAVDDHNYINNSVIISNYPNPCNMREDNINFYLNLTHKHYVDPKISVYNIKGELVETILLNSSHIADRIISWKPQNRIYNGVYFYRFISKEIRSRAHKMLILSN